MRKTRAAGAADAAAAAASEAARTLAARSHESRQTTPEPEATEPKNEASTSPEQVEKLLAKRPSVMAREEILARRGMNDEEAPEAPSEEPVEAKAEPEVEKPAETAPKEEVQPEAPKTVRVKVDGEEFDADAKEVEEAGGVRAYQIQRASENRLQKANALVEETRKQMAAMAQNLQSQATAKQQPSQAEFIKDRINKIRFGTDEEASLAMNEVVAAAHPRIDQQAMTLQVSANLKHDMADAQFRQEFADVLANPMAKKLSEVLHREALAAHAPNGQVNWQSLSAIDWGLFKRNIGNQLRSAFGKPSQQATSDKKPADTTSPAADKEARKASIVNLPKAAARADLPKEEKEPTPEETRQSIISEMKKARGQ